MTSSEENALTQPESEEAEIVTDVWAHNFEEQFQVIQGLISRNSHTYISFVSVIHHFIYFHFARIQSLLDLCGLAQRVCMSRFGRM